MSKTLCISLISILFLSAGFAQQTAELCGIHFDRPLYLAGDTARFQIYMPKSFEYDESLARILFLSPDNQLVGDIYLPVLQEMSRGYFAIPQALETGIYQIHVLLFEKETAQNKLVLAHSFWVLNPDSLERSYLGNIQESPTGEDHLPISIQLKQDRIKPRQTIAVQITTQEDNPVHFSLAVTRDYGLEGALGQSLHRVAYPGFQVDKRIALTGVAYSEAIPLKHRDLVIFDRESGIVTTTRTDQEGRFHTKFSPFKGKKSLQFWDLFDREIEVAITHQRGNPPELSGERSLDNSQFDSLLSLTAQRKKIMHLFSPDQDTSSHTNRADWGPVPDLSVFPATYEAFANLEEFLESIRTPLKIKRKKEVLVPKMINPHQKPFFKEKPVFIIDQVIKTFEAFMELRMNEIIQLDFYQEPSSLRPFGPLGRNGIVAIKTKTPLAHSSKDNIMVLHGIQAPISYPVELSSPTKDHLPNLPSVIYWNPEITSDDTGKATIIFHHSDEIGTFNIRIVGKSESGKMGLQNYRYEVKP